MGSEGSKADREENQGEERQQDNATGAPPGDPAEYTPTKSAVSEERMDEWRARELTGDLERDAVPGIGPATIAKLKGNEETKTTFRLMGAYLQGLTTGATTLGAAQTFKDCLEAHDTPAQYRDTVVTAIVEKITGGFVFPMAMSEDRLSSSRMTSEKMEAFLAKQLTGDLATDFSGISEDTAKNMAKDGGIENTWMFFAVALQSENADDFEQTIKEFGVNPGWAATVVHQVAEKLTSGLTLPYLG